MGKRNTSITIGDHLSDFVAAQVKEGRYGNASDVIRAGLRLLEERETKLAALRAALIEGAESGTPLPFDLGEFVAEMQREKSSEA